MKIRYLLIFLGLFLFSGCDLYFTEPINTTTTNPYQLTFKEYKLQIGDSYRAESDFTIGNGNKYYIAGVTYNKTICMCERQLQGISTDDLDISVNLYEDGSFTGGTQITNFNRNRNIGDNSTFKIYENVTLIDLGNKLPYETYLNGAKRISTASSNEVAYSMKLNTNYILEIENTGIKAADLTLIWNWLENTCNN